MERKSCKYKAYIELKNDDIWVFESDRPLPNDISFDMLKYYSKETLPDVIDAIANVITTFIIDSNIRQVVHLKDGEVLARA